MYTRRDVDILTVVDVKRSYESGQQMTTVSMTAGWASGDQFVVCH
jgi:hypothetical protein